jgi:hypothetical protein
VTDYLKVNSANLVPIVIAIASVAVMWGANSTRMETIEESNLELKNDLKEIKKIVTSIQIQQAKKQ